MCTFGGSAARIDCDQFIQTVRGTGYRFQYA
jgi:DNA-binding response OmpR family regulator